MVCKLVTFLVIQFAVLGSDAFLSPDVSRVSTTTLSSTRTNQNEKIDDYSSTLSDGSRTRGSSPFWTNENDRRMRRPMGQGFRDSADLNRSVPYTRAGRSNVALPRNIWAKSAPITVQGGSLRTLSFATEAIRRVGVFLRTEGRPLNANLELWQGPDNTPQRMSIYVEDGNMRPFAAIIETPGGQNSVAIRNTGQMEFPLMAAIEADVEGRGGSTSSEFNNILRQISPEGYPRTIQGGAVFTTPFAPDVSVVQIILKTDGRPLKARIELLQGPNNNKQVMEVYTEDGRARPFVALIETPGSGNVVRIVNTATVEFPLSAVVEPYATQDYVTTYDGEMVGNGYFVLDKQN